MYYTTSHLKPWIDQQRDLCRKKKCKLQSLSELHGMPETKTTFPKHIVWNDSHSVPSFQASKHTYFIFTYYCFGNTYIKIWSNYFGVVWLHDNFILHYNRIFRVHDAKMRRRLNTGLVVSRVSSHIQTDYINETSSQ